MAKKAYVVKTDGSVNEVWAEWDLDQIQQEVGGYISSVSFGDKKYFAYINDEGKLMNLPENVIATDLWYDSGQTILLGDYLCGNAVFFGEVDDEGNDTDAPKELWNELEKVVTRRHRINTSR